MGTEGRSLAGWLLSRRADIEAAMRASLGEAAPAPGSPEAEALRRFRAFAIAALARQDAVTPSLEGLRSSERRCRRLLEAWLAASLACAPEPDRPALCAALAPLAERFLLALRETARARRASGAAGAAGRRRAVSAAIDRVCDAFLAVDAETGEIADANPAAGALLGTTREALLGAEAITFVPAEAREAWWAELDAVSEGSEPRRFRAAFLDREGRALSVDASVTRYATRSRTLALVLART